jgi:hypothetical protein
MKGEWHTYPILNLMDISSLKSAIILNFSLVYSDNELSHLFDSLIKVAKSSNNNVNELNLKIASGAYKSSIEIDFMKPKKVEKKDTFYGSYNDSTNQCATLVLRTIDKIIA